MKELIMAKCTINIKGNLARDVEAKISKAGKPYSVLSVGSTPSKKNAQGEWENGETIWFNVTVFGELNPFEFVKGTPVELEGTFTQRSYTKKDGTKGTSNDVVTDLIKSVPRAKSESPNSQAAQTEWSKPTGWSEIPPIVAEDAPF